MSERLLKIRHILYRFYTKVYFGSKTGKLVRSLFWDELRIGQGIRVIYKKTNNVFKHYSLKQIGDKPVQDQFAKENATWTFQDDIIYEVDREIYIEPKLSLAFAEPNLFVAQTKSKAHKHITPQLRYASVLRPKRKTVIEIPALIHFDGYAGRNLYHFVDDALNPLLLILRSGIVDTAIPILVHQQIYHLPFFQYFVKTLPSLKRCTWLVQKEGEWIRTKLMYKGLSSHLLWKELYDELSQVTTKNPSRRVFLNRKTAFQRNIINIDEVMPLLERYGFETVYAEDLTYEQQVALFSEVKYLVAIHGAGITNLLHSDLRQAHLLEIFSCSLLNPHYYWVLNQMDIFYYDVVVGSEFDLNWNYTVEKDEFERRLKAMFQSMYK